MSWKIKAGPPKPREKSALPDLWLIIPLVCLLATFKVWDYYYNSSDMLDRTWVSNMILSMGSLFSLATGFFIWNLQKRHRELHQAYTQLKNMQDNLVQSEKLASVGRVVSGIVHELNTPLVTMQGYTQMILKGVVKEEAMTSVALIHKQAERCHKIVRDLLTYARWDKPKFREMPVQELIDLAVASMPPDFHTEVTVKKNYPPGSVTMEGDREQLQRVLVNLLMNAWQAMQESKKSFPKQIDISLTPKEKYLMIYLTDNGPGIPEEIVSKIFEPFYTTKAAGKGTGLGLSLTQAILHMHQGKIEVFSEEGEGATFKIELPYKIAEGEALVAYEESLKTASAEKAF